MIDLIIQILLDIATFITKTFKLIIEKLSVAGFVAVVILMIFFFWDFLKLQADHITAYYLIEKGDNAYSNAQYMDAISNYQRALTLYPEHYIARYNLGNIYVAYEDYEQAAQCYEEALYYKNDFLKARIDFGIILADGLKRIDDAIEQYKIAVSSRPLDLSKGAKQDKAIAYYNMGLAYKDKSLLLGYDKEKSTEALENAAESYRNSLRFRKENYDTFYNLALTYQLLGDFENSRTYYCKAINMQPFNYEAHYNFAILLSKKGDYFESVEELEKAGIILDSKGDSYHTMFVYSVLNDISQRAILKQGLKSFVEKSDKHLDYKPDEIQYVDGKVVISDKLDKRILENMKSCQICKDK